MSLVKGPRGEGAAPCGVGGGGVVSGKPTLVHAWEGESAMSCAHPQDYQGLSKRAD